MSNKIMIVDNVHQVLLDKLSIAGYEIITAYNLNRQQILDRIGEMTGVVIRSRISIDKEFIDKAKSLKFIGRVGAGMDSIDIDYCAENNIICLNSPEGNRDAVAEHCTGMLLALLNNLLPADNEVKNGVWSREKNRGVELSSLTVGIIGYGNTGSSFAKKISGFGCNVISYDKYKSNYSDEFVKETDMSEIFEKSDVLSLHVPLNNETQYLVNTDYINNFDKNIILLNTSRGPVVKTSDLVSGLKNGKIISAALDVIEYEEASFESTKNMTDNEDFKFLSKSKNVILTPHIAGWTHQSKIKLAEVLAQKILNLKIL